VSRARPVLAAVPAHEEARWRSALAARVRPEFRVDRYLPPREHLVLYGPHCSVAGCDRPGNERFVGPARLCERHARIWDQVRGMTIEAWLAEAPEIRRRSDARGCRATTSRVSRLCSATSCGFSCNRCMTAASR